MGDSGWKVQICIFFDWSFCWSNKYSKLNVQGREFKECTLEDLEVLNNFKIPQTIEIKEDSSIGNAANHLKNLKHSYLILEGNDRIVTPWDIVMKTLT